MSALLQIKGNPVRMTVRREKARRVAVLLAAVVVALAAAVATPAATGSTAPTWFYDEGQPGAPPFSFVAPLDPLLTLSGGTDQSLAFQVTEAAIAALPPGDLSDNQITVSATTSQIDLPMAAGPDTLKDFLTLGGDLETVRGVSVKYYYRIDGRTAGGAAQWLYAGAGGPGAFTLTLPAYAGGHTIAYRVTFIAPAAVMVAPVMLDDVVIGYGPYVKPPKIKGNGGGTGDNTGKTGSDNGKAAANTGRGSGSGSGAGSTTGNGSGTGGTDGSRSTSATASTGAGSPKAPVVHKASSTVRDAHAVSSAPVTSSATGGSALVAGYAVVASSASAALGAGGAAVAAAPAAAGGGRSVGGGMSFGAGDTYLVFGAAIMGLLLLPIPFVARRLRRVAGYDHEASADGGWRADALR